MKEIADKSIDMILTDMEKTKINNYNQEFFQKVREEEMGQEEQKKLLEQDRPDALEKMKK